MKNKCFTAVLAGTFTLAGPALAQAPIHPLDGLSAREHWTIYDALVASGRTDTTTSYLYVGLNEPPKSEVLAWRAGQPFRREALVHLIQGGRGYEAIVDLPAKVVRSWTEVPGRQFMTSFSEAERVKELALADPRVREAIRKRGVTDFTHIDCGPANHGYFDLPEERGRRVVHAMCGDDHGRVSGYGEDFEGLVIVIDLTEGRILRVVDTGVRPRGVAFGDYDAEAIGPTRDAGNPVRMVQPRGPTYTLNGQEVSWKQILNSAPPSP